jgi:TRAP-type C4-dicarboxylate transport system permease small subunit
MFAFIRFIHSLSKLCGIISTTLIASAVLVTTQMVVVRYLFKMSTVWQTEYVIFSLAAATFIGAPYVLMKKGHVNVDLIPYYLNQKGKNILAIVAAILALLFLLVLFYSSVQLTNHAWVKNIKTPTIWSFPMWKVYIFLPIGMGIMILQYLADILSIIYKHENVEGN